MAGGPLRAQTPPPLDPQSPLNPLPGLGVAWPDLNQRDPLEAAPASASAASDETPRYAVVLAGVEDIANITRRFDELSTLRQSEQRGVNAAQIDRRAREDAELLDRLMRSEGYYDASVETEVTPATESARLVVTLRVTPGPQYKFGEVEIRGLATTGPAAPVLREAYNVAPTDPIVAQTVIDGRAALIEKLGRGGYPFAKVAEPGITVDHATREARLGLDVDTGGKRNFGSILVTGTRPPFDARHAQVIARFRPGDTYDQYLVDDMKRAIVATGLVSQVRVDVIEGKLPGTVDLTTAIDPAPYRTLSGEAGYGTGEGLRVEASWQHRNLIRPEGAATFRGVAGTQEQLLGTTLRMGNFRRRDQVLNARLLAAHQNRVAYDAYSLEFAASLERQTTIIWQKPWAYSLGFEFIGSRERNRDPLRGVLASRDFFIAALPGSLAYDGSDDLLDPKRGYRLSARASPEVSVQGRSFAYVRAQFDGSYYQPVGSTVVFAGRARLGFLAGAPRARIAPSRLYYSGGGGSVRGYGYQLIGPRNPVNEPVGGRSLAEFSLEARVRLPFFGGNFGVVPFLDAGNVYDSTLPRLSGLRVGAGMGLRYYSNFGPIRIDVGTPIGRRRGEAPVAIQVSLGQAF